VAQRVAAFKSRFETLLPGFFRAERVGWMTNAQYDDAIVQSFEMFPALRDRFVATTANFTGSLTPAFNHFARTFPDLKPIGAVYLVHSLGEFDGGTKPVAGQPRLVFGADVIAQLHAGNLQPFFHHELFHVYHAQFFTECEQMWCALWSEGLAVLAAQRLNPSATDAELLLDSPQPIRAEVERDRRAALCAVAARLHSTEGADTRRCSPMARRSNICRRAADILSATTWLGRPRSIAPSRSSRIWTTTRRTASSPRRCPDSRAARRLRLIHSDSAHRLRRNSTRRSGPMPSRFDERRTALDNRPHRCTFRARTRTVVRRRRCENGTSVDAG